MTTPQYTSAPIDPQPATATHYTTLWGGAGVVVSSVLTASPSLLPVLPGDWFLLISWLPALQILSTLVLTVSVVVLALGVRGETGIVGASVAGKISLVGFGVLRLLLIVLPASFPLVANAVTIDADLFTVVAYLNVVLYTLPLIAALIAGVVIVRVHVLQGFARWGLLAAAAANLAGILLSSIPIESLLYGSSWLYSASLLLLIALGIAYMLSGQSEALRRRWKIINDAW